MNWPVLRQPAKLPFDGSPLRRHGLREAIMPGVTEPETGLFFYELSHEWGYNAPALPGFDDVKLYRSSTHAKNGVMATRIRMVMHSGTHVNAPLHLIQRGAGVGDIALDRFFGSGVVLPIPKQQWELE